MRDETKQGVQVQTALARMRDDVTHSHATIAYDEITTVSLSHALMTIDEHHHASCRQHTMVHETTPYIMTLVVSQRPSSATLSRSSSPTSQLELRYMPLNRSAARCEASQTLNPAGSSGVSLYSFYISLRKVVLYSHEPGMHFIGHVSRELCFDAP